MSDKVKRAVLASQAVQPLSGFIAEEAEFVNTRTEIAIDDSGEIRVSSETDTSKLDVLLEILKPLKLTDENRDTLLNRTQNAVINFYLASSVSSRADQKKKLEAFSEAMSVAAGAWESLGHDLQQSLLRFLEEKAPILDKASDDGFLARLERSHHIRKALAHDVHVAAHGAKGLVRILGSDRSHSPPEYQLIIHVCIIWREHTGREPTLSRNVNERRAERVPTPFERFVRAAIAPREIGERMVRDAVAAFVAGHGDKGQSKIV